MNTREEIIVELLLQIKLFDDGVGWKRHEKAGPKRDEENNHILSASTFLAYPHCMMNRVICSFVDVSSCLENLVKSGTLNLGGKGI
jgi:hypothetical protein